MRNNAIVKAYERYAGRYDLIFGRVLENGRKAAVNMINDLPGPQVLEIGVGTGLSLPYYSDRHTVTGLDLCSRMLEKARQRIAAEVACKSALCMMDAERLGFCDRSFDKVVAMHTVSVTPHPALLLGEMKRVCRPGGDIFIVNHFTKGRNPASGKPNGMDHVVSAFAGFIGFRPVFPMDEFIALLSLEVVRTVRVNALGFCTLIHARND